MSLGQHLRVFACVVVMGLLIGFVVNGTETETNSAYIEYIQSQSWPYKVEETVVEVFQDKFDQVYWEYYKARSGQHVVQMTGSLEGRHTMLQFIVQEDLLGYEIGALKLNDVVLSKQQKWLYVQGFAS